MAARGVLVVAALVSLWSLCDAEAPDSTPVNQEDVPTCFHELLSCASRLLEEGGVDYYIDNDLLLGQERTGKFIPWSGNLDLSVFEPSFPRIQKLIGSSFQEKKIGIPSCKNVLYFNEHPDRKRFRMVHSCNHVLHPVGKQTLEITKTFRALSKPTKECHLKDVKTRCPSAASDLLVGEYGPQWKTPKFLKWNGHRWLNQEELEAESGAVAVKVKEKLSSRARYGDVEAHHEIAEHIKNQTKVEREKATEEAQQMGSDPAGDLALASARKKQEAADGSRRAVLAKQRAAYLADVLAWKRRQAEFERKRRGLPVVSDPADSGDLAKDLPGQPSIDNSAADSISDADKLKQLQKEKEESSAAASPPAAAGNLRREPTAATGTAAAGLNQPAASGAGSSPPASSTGGELATGAASTGAEESSTPMEAHAGMADVSKPASGPSL